MFVVSPRDSCGAVDEEICSDHRGVVVPIPIQLLRKMEFTRVDVESSDPTVSCDVVAMRAEPSEFETMMELAAKAVLPVPPLAMVLEKEPAPTQVLFIAKHPLLMLNPTVAVVVPLAPPRMFRDWSVVVPFAVMEKAVCDDVAYVVGEDVAR